MIIHAWFVGAGLSQQGNPHVALTLEQVTNPFLVRAEKQVLADLVLLVAYLALPSVPGLTG